MQINIANHFNDPSPVLLIVPVASFDEEQVVLGWQRVCDEVCGRGGAFLLFYERKESKVKSQCLKFFTPGTDYHNGVH